MTRACGRIEARRNRGRSRRILGLQDRHQQQRQRGVRRRVIRMASSYTGSYPAARLRASRPRGVARRKRRPPSMRRHRAGPPIPACGARSSDRRRRDGEHQRRSPLAVRRSIGDPRSMSSRTVACCARQPPRESPGCWRDVRNSPRPRRSVRSPERDPGSRTLRIPTPRTLRENGAGYSVGSGSPRRSLRQLAARCPHAAGDARRLQLDEAAPRTPATAVTTGWAAIVDPLCDGLARGDPLLSGRSARWPSRIRAVGSAAARRWRDRCRSGRRCAVPSCPNAWAVASGATPRASSHLIAS